MPTINFVTNNADTLKYFKPVLAKSVMPEWWKNAKIEMAVNTEFVQTGKAVAGADPSGNNNPDEGAKVMMGIMRDFEKRADKNASAMA